MLTISQIERIIEKKFYFLGSPELREENTCLICGTESKEETCIECQEKFPIKDKVIKEV